MPTPTYDLISEQVLGSAVATVTFGSGNTLTQTYKDLVLEATIKGDGTAGQYPRIKINSDTGTNYSYTWVSGNGTSATSNRASTTANGYVTSNVTMNSTSPSLVLYVNFMSYANTSIYETYLSRPSEAGTAAEATVGLWRSTNAITQLDVLVSSGNFAIGSTFRLWGVSG